MSKEYEKITKQLESLMGHCGSMKGSEDADPVWEEDVQALQEAIDIIADYGDSALYKMWGNGIALPCATFVFEGIMEVLREEEQHEESDI